MVEFALAHMGTVPALAEIVHEYLHQSPGGLGASQPAVQLQLVRGLPQVLPAMGAGQSDDTLRAVATAAAGAQLSHLRATMWQALAELAASNWCRTDQEGVWAAAL